MCLHCVRVSAGSLVLIRNKWLFASFHTSFAPSDRSIDRSTWLLTYLMWYTLKKPTAEAENWEKPRRGLTIHYWWRNIFSVRPLWMAIYAAAGTNTFKRLLICFTEKAKVPWWRNDPSQTDSRQKRARLVTNRHYCSIRLFSCTTEVGLASVLILNRCSALTLCKIYVVIAIPYIHH